MPSTQNCSPPPHLFNVVEQNNNHHKLQKSKHGELEEEQQEAFEYSHHDDEPPQPSCGSSRTSVSSSPSHEFSFTVCSLYTSPTTTDDLQSVFRESLTNNSSSISSAAATAIDLSPADEIFLHGHLLPLHLLSGCHLSISPRSSTNSLDGFALPKSFSNPSSVESSTMDQDAQDRALDSSMEKLKSRSFSLFRNRTTTTSKSRNLSQNQETAENKSSKQPHQYADENNHNHKNLNKVKFDISNAIKQYAKLVRPLLTFKHGNSISNSSRQESRIQRRGQTFSYSGKHSGPKSNNKQGDDDQVLIRGRFSAPASVRTSPTNSAMFLEASRSNTSSSSSDSTMEELQAAIQAAIAHCKNSSIAAAVKMRLWMGICRRYQHDLRSLAGG